MAAYTTINDPSAYFKVQLYTGTGSSHAVAFNDTDTDMQPDLVWIKQRNAVMDHRLFDSVRGVQKYLKPNGDTHQGTDSNSLTAFGSNGFTVGSWDNVNDSSDTYVAWCWKESATAGFDMLTFEGNTTARTISHSLSAVPELMIIKGYDQSSTFWALYHGANTSAPETDQLYLNSTNATSDNATFWNDTAPTSSVFSVGISGHSNPNGDSTMAYLWTSKQGFSKFGSYTGNGAADGPFIYTGFRPAFVMVKRTNSTGSWGMRDNKREAYNNGQDFLLANTTAAEQTSATIDFLSNGFKLRHSGSEENTSGSTMIYMAFAEAPFVNSNGVPCNAR